MQALGGPGSHVLHYFQAHPCALLDGALGKQPPVPTYDGPGQGSKLHKNTCAQVLWAWDKLVKNLIMVMWRKRKALAGSYTVSKGRLIHTPADDASVQWLRRYDISERHEDVAMSVHSTSQGVLVAMAQALGPETSEATPYYNRYQKELLSRMGGS